MTQALNSCFWGIAAHEGFEYLFGQVISDTFVLKIIGIKKAGGICSYESRNMLLWRCG